MYSRIRTCTVQIVVWACCLADTGWGEEQYLSPSLGQPNAAELLLDDEGLRLDLNDSEYEPLLQWALNYLANCQKVKSVTDCYSATKAKLRQMVQLALAATMESVEP